MTGVRDRLRRKLVEDQQGRAGDTIEDLVGLEDVAERLHVDAGKPKASVQQERSSKKTSNEDDQLISDTVDYLALVTRFGVGIGGLFSSDDRFCFGTEGFFNSGDRFCFWRL
ncbi:unnamed protein product [Cochlearia groenlandica]